MIVALTKTYTLDFSSVRPEGSEATRNELEGFERNFIITKCLSKIDPQIFLETRFHKCLDTPVMKYHIFAQAH